MPLSVAIQMDPIETVNIDADSTFLMALEAQRRGHHMVHYQPKDLALRDGRLYATVRSLKVERRHGAHYALGTPERVDLSGFDIVLMRQDPPFDMAYITATHLLEHIQPGVLVVNDPAHVRNAPEKLFTTLFPGLMPPTLITGDLEEIRAFRREFGDIVVKPLYGNGGAGVFHLKPDDENLGSVVEMFRALSNEPLMIQRYLPEIKQGDKRIILIDGEPVGAVNRLPLAGEARANFHAGGKAAKTGLTDRERDICDAIGPTLRARGLVFVGIDVIGDYLTEINVTSPTGLQEINRLDGLTLERNLWDAIEGRHADMRPAA